LRSKVIDLSTPSSRLPTQRQHNLQRPDRTFTSKDPLLSESVHGSIMLATGIPSTVRILEIATAVSSPSP
jgi:hypothetical protein